MIDRGFSRHCRGIVHDLDARLGQRPPPLGIEVVADHAPAGGGEVLRERATHDAEADDADRTLCRHARSLVVAAALDCNQHAEAAP